MGKGRSVRVVIIFVSIFILLLLSSLSILVILLVLMGYMGNKEDGSNNKNDFAVYRYYKIDPKANESSVGFINTKTLSHSNNKFHFYKEDESFVLISDFGTDEYQCTGSCSCENARKSTTTMTKGVFYLVASLSSIVAYDIAKKYFEQECENEMEEYCSSENSIVISEVVDCEPVRSKEQEEAANSDAQLDPEGREKLPKKSYYCTGNCLPSDITEYNKFLFDRGEPQVPRNIRKEFQKKVKKFGCRKMKVSSSLEAGFPTEEVMELEGRFESSFHFAEYKFLMSLNEYCAKNSVITIEGINDAGRFPQCVGLQAGVDFSKEDIVPINEMNPSVHCIEDNTCDV